MTQLPVNTEPRAWPGEIPLTSLYTVGTGGQIFFHALKTQGKLIATRCQPCEQVYLPSRSFCERCFAELKEQVEHEWPHGGQNRLQSRDCHQTESKAYRLDPRHRRVSCGFLNRTLLLVHRNAEHDREGEVRFFPKAKRCPGRRQCTRCPRRSARCVFQAHK